ncbi:uncharacterized protein LOC135378997 [Ornithodoros turicata]|uniref:uncharacterized protein LOC135378997 n=1 Tax=Ornithodoros turicata TaxID=34597 RepID=UPI003138B578
MSLLFEIVTAVLIIIIIMAGIFTGSSQTLSENESATSSTEELRRNEEHITTDAHLELQPFTHVMRALDTPEDNDTDITASPDASPPDSTIAGFEGHECLQQKARAVSIERDVSTCSIQVDSGVIRRDSGVIRIREQYTQDDLWYDMDYKNGGRKLGKCVIFNFSKVAGYPERIGTEKDEERIRTLFEGQFGFDVDVHGNLKKEAMLRTLEKLAGEDHSSSCCLCLFLLSHGDDDGIICSDGQEIQLSKVYAMFDPRTCKGLAAKPKLFFVQACRGKEIDTSVRHDGPAHTDARSFKTTLPRHADFFVFYATCPGLYWYRDENDGSFFIQTLCQVLERNFHHSDFLTMMTLVMLHVAQQENKMTKQMPNTNSTLRKNLRLRKKVVEASKVTALAHGAGLLEDIAPQSRTSSDDVTALANAAGLLEDITPQSSTSSDDEDKMGDELSRTQPCRAPAHSEQRTHSQVLSPSGHIEDFGTLEVQSPREVIWRLKGISRLLKVAPVQLRYISQALKSYLLQKSICIEKPL